jgi:hypothetical protein
MDPDLSSELTSQQALRFWDKVERASGCWPWRSSKSDGYGVYSVRCKGLRRNYGAHRLAYRLLVGAIPTGLNLDHLCRNRACCNPQHMEPVTMAENIRRGFAHRKR